MQHAQQQMQVQGSSLRAQFAPGQPMVTEESLRRAMEELAYRDSLQKSAAAGGIGAMIGGSFPPGALGAGAPAPSLTVHDALEQLNSAVSRLTQVAGDLLMRLDPVLVPSSPSNQAIGPTLAGGSVIAQITISEQQRVNAIVGVLCDILGRLQV